MTAAIFDSASAREARSASFTAATTRSWSISTSAGSTADGSIVTDTTSWLPGDAGRHDATAGGALDYRGSELLLDAQHLALHLLRHPLEVAEPHPDRSSFRRGRHGWLPARPRAAGPSLRHRGPPRTAGSGGTRNRARGGRSGGACVGDDMPAELS